MPINKQIPGYIVDYGRKEVTDFYLKLTETKKVN